MAFLREWLLPDLVALTAMGLLLVTGILGTEETLAVFSNSAPTVIGRMFVLSAALERTGAIDALARLFLRLAGASATMGVDARPFTVAVMFGASASFATPIGYQTNTTFSVRAAIGSWIFLASACR